MIKSLKLINFMRHESMEVQFGEGLQVVKGANESGKSSVLLGIAYAFFGAKALRTNFAQAVTHGKPEASLKVEVVIEIAGRKLVVTRSKGGAEISEGGKVTVTGQTEVTTYLATLIGADANAAGRLMLANQGNLRGSLENGPKATAEMIESLADFDLFERLIEGMQEHLMLGNTDVVASQVITAQNVIEGMTAPVEPDLADLDKKLDALAAGGAALKAQADILFDLDGKEAEKLAAVETRHNNRLNLEQQAQDQAAAQSKLEQQLTELQAATACAYTAEHVQAKRDEITAARAYADTARAFSEFNALAYPSEFWEGTREEFDAELAGFNAELVAINRSIADRRGDIKILEQAKVTATLCGYCGKDFSSIPKIAEKNAEIEAQLHDMRVMLGMSERRLKEVSADIFACGVVAKLAKPFADAALRLERYVTVDENFWPPKLTWAGPALTSEAPVLSVLTVELSQMEQAIRASAAAKSKAEIVAESIGFGRRKLQDLQARLATFDDATAEGVAGAKAAKVAAHKAWADAYQVYSDAELRVATLQRERDDVVKNYETAKATWDTAAATLAEKKTMLEDMQFNNSLLRKVRAARPVIADRLWHLVLGSVSQMFSRMRGEASIVTKSKDGFSVNGAAVESLSGSTLDLLGLALRVALTRTFIPHSPFLILDEPFSAADSDRTSAMLAFIQTSGFSQVLLVTHEDLSAGIADNLVEL